MASGTTFDEVIGAGSADRPDPVQEPVRGPGRDPGVRAQANARRSRGRGRWPPPPGSATSATSRQTARRATRRTSSPTEVQRLLRTKPYKYLLILGNDDAVPYFHVENPLADYEEAVARRLGAPVRLGGHRQLLHRPRRGQVRRPGPARSPASRRATTRSCCSRSSARISPPDGGGFALVNQERKGQAGVVLNKVADLGQVRLQYTPPTDAASSSAPTRTPRTPATCTSCSTASAC